MVSEVDQDARWDVTTSHKWISAKTLGAFRWPAAARHLELNRVSCLHALQVDKVKISIIAPVQIKRVKVVLLCY